MASALLRSFPIASSITTGSYASRASWHKIGKLPKEFCTIKSPQNNLTHLHHHFKSINLEVIGSKCDKCERTYLMKANAAESHESYELQSQDVSKGILESIKDAVDVFFKFGRLYVTFSMVLSVTSASLLAVETLSDLSPAFFIGLFQYMAAFYFLLIYSTGLNELADVEIDKINKPYLPMASGEYSSRIGVFVVVLSLLTSLGIGWIVGSKPILWGLFACFALGTAYSANLPLLRWKRFTSMTLVYSVTYPMILNTLAAFLHMKTHVLKRTATFPRSIIFFLAMKTVFCIIIGLVKDIPDIEGDKAGGIQTLAVRIGAKRVFWLCVSLLEMAYGGAILVGASSPLLWTKIVMVLAHSILALVLWYNAKSVDLKSKVDTQGFYKTIFKLYCVETIVVALAR